jgi:hypothetical protein
MPYQGLIIVKTWGSTMVRFIGDPQKDLIVEDLSTIVDTII